MNISLTPEQARFARDAILQVLRMDDADPGYLDREDRALAEDLQKGLRRATDTISQ